MSIFKYIVYRSASSSGLKNAANRCISHKGRKITLMKLGYYWVDKQKELGRNLASISKPKGKLSKQKPSCLN